MLLLLLLRDTYHHKSQGGAQKRYGRPDKGSDYDHHRRTKKQHKYEVRCPTPESAFF